MTSSGNQLGVAIFAGVGVNGIAYAANNPAYDAGWTGSHGTGTGWTGVTLVSKLLTGSETPHVNWTSFSYCGAISLQYDWS